MFGERAVKLQDSFLDELEQKIETDKCFRNVYTKWYSEYNLQQSRRLGSSTASSRAATGAPSSYNTPHSMYYKFPVRSIAFPQGNNYMCAFLSLCSAIYAFANGDTQIQHIARQIHELRQPTQDPNVIENLKRAVDNAAKGRFIFHKITNFQIHNRNEPGPVLGVLMDDTGSTEHAVSFWGHEIFDSNLEFTLNRGETYKKTKMVLDHCCYPRKFNRLKLAYRFQEQKQKNICYHSRKRKKKLNYIYNKFITFTFNSIDFCSHLYIMHMQLMYQTKGFHFPFNIDK